MEQELRVLRQGHFSPTVQKLMLKPLSSICLLSTTLTPLQALDAILELDFAADVFTG